MIRLICIRQQIFSLRWQQPRWITSWRWSLDHPSMARWPSFLLGSGGDKLGWCQSSRTYTDIQITYNEYDIDAETEWQPFCGWRFAVRLFEFTHWPLGDLNESLDMQISGYFFNWWLRYFMWNFPHVIVTEPYWWYVNICSGNGFVPPSNKAVTWTNVDPVPWLHVASLCHNGLHFCIAVFGFTLTPYTYYLTTLGLQSSHWYYCITLPYVS